MSIHVQINFSQTLVLVHVRHEKVVVRHALMQPPAQPVLMVSIYIFLCASLPALPVTTPIPPNAMYVSQTVPTVRMVSLVSPATQGSGALLVILQRAEIAFFRIGSSVMIVIWSIGTDAIAIV